MLEIMDTGTVWIRGNAKPDYGLRVGDNIYVPGKDATDEINCWIVGDILCVDLHDKNNNKRIARKFPLNVEGTEPAALFGGFKKTKHSDLKAVTANCSGFEEHIVQGEDYLKGNIQEMSHTQFWEKVSFPEN
jgi:hypothetical protein